MICVVGCVHDIQSSNPVLLLEGSPAVKEQRDRFQQLLERMLFTKKAELVAEEWGCKSESFAQALATKHGVRYLNVNACSEDLVTLKIPRDYMNTSKYAAEQLRGWLKQRERFMVDTIRSV